MRRHKRYASDPELKIPCEKEMGEPLVILSEKSTDRRDGGWWSTGLVKSSALSGT